MNQSNIQTQIVDTLEDGVTWGVNVSLGMAALLCVAFLVGFLIRKL